MSRLASIFLLILCYQAPLAAQSKPSSGQAAEGSATAVVPPAPEPRDTALSGQPLLERTVGGAVVGAVTGATLSAQGAECAPSRSAVGAIVGGVFGAVRGALRLNPSSHDEPATDTRGGEEAPFPFDGDKCEKEEP